MKTQLEKFQTDKEVNEFLFKTIDGIYQQRESQVGEGLMREMERFVMLTTIDHLWIDHLDAIDDLREGIGLRGYAQRDPLVEYKAEAFSMFEKLVGTIDYEIARKIFRIQIGQRPQPQVPVGQEVHPETEKPVSADGPPGPPPEASKQPAASGAFAKAFGGAGSQSSPPASGSTGGSVRRGKKIGRNDPCWCGSGKKWKKCHYPARG
jgi:preprotein translocase subunit SecA